MAHLMDQGLKAVSISNFCQGSLQTCMAQLSATSQQAALLCRQTDAWLTKVSSVNCNATLANRVMLPGIFCPDACNDCTTGKHKRNWKQSCSYTAATQVPNAIRSEADCQYQCQILCDCAPTGCVTPARGPFGFSDPSLGLPSHA